MEPRFSLSTSLLQANSAFQTILVRYCDSNIWRTGRSPRERMGGTAQRMRSIRASAPNKRPETRVGLAPTSSLYSKQQYRVPDSPTGSHLQKPHSIKNMNKCVINGGDLNVITRQERRSVPKKENNQTGYPAL